MDTTEARFACLKLARRFHKHHSSDDFSATKTDDGTVLATATKWADFVIGKAVRESAGLTKKGADEK